MNRRHTEQGNERKRQLLDTAQQLFAARGYAATRVADICDAAGVAKGLFYWYFPTKESLFAELVRTMRHELRRAQGQAMAAAGDPLQRIRLGAEASVRFIAEHRTYFALIDMERTDRTVAAILDEGGDVYINDVIRLVRDAQQAGQLPDEDPRFLSVGVLGAVSSFTQALRNGRLDMDVDVLASRVGEWVAQALGQGTNPTTEQHGEWVAQALGQGTTPTTEQHGEWVAQALGHGTTPTTEQRAVTPTSAVR